MTDRIESLDTLKGIALFFVVFIHSKSFFSNNQILEAATYLAANMSRIAVPAFFLTSGYLASLKIRDGRPEFPKKQMRNVGKYYIEASLLYLPPVLGMIAVNRYMNLQVIDKWVNLNVAGIEGLLNVFYIGKAIAPFLWFLPALFFSLGMVYIADRKDLIKPLLAGAAGLHVLAILENSYRLLGTSIIPQEDALFFGLFFTATGFYIGREGLSEVRDASTFRDLFIGFSALHLLERIYISLTVEPWQAYYWDPFFWGAYTFFTAPMTLALFMYFLKRPELGKDTRINLYGKYTLPGYILHAAMIGLFVALSQAVKAAAGIQLVETFAWDLIFLPLIYVLTMEAGIRYRKLRG